MLGESPEIAPLTTPYTPDLFQFLHPNFPSGYNFHTLWPIFSFGSENRLTCSILAMRSPSPSTAGETE